jgi:hypothetical protein
MRSFKQKSHFILFVFFDLPIINTSLKTENLRGFNDSSLIGAVASISAFYSTEGLLLQACSCPFIRYFRLVFWNDITIIWDENIVCFFN